MYVQSSRGPVRGDISSCLLCPYNYLTTNKNSMTQPKCPLKVTVVGAGIGSDSLALRKAEDLTSYRRSVCRYSPT